MARGGPQKDSLGLAYQTYGYWMDVEVHMICTSWFKNSHKRLQTQGLQGRQEGKTWIFTQILCCTKHMGVGTYLTCAQSVENFHACFSKYCVGFTPYSSSQSQMSEAITVQVQYILCAGAVHPLVVLCTGAIMLGW